jgi:hypothetical protein
MHWLVNMLFPYFDIPCLPRRVSDWSPCFTNFATLAFCNYKLYKVAHTCDFLMCYNQECCEQSSHCNRNQISQKTHKLSENYNINISVMYMFLYVHSHFTLHLLHVRWFFNERLIWNDSLFQLLIFLMFQGSLSRVVESNAQSRFF